MRLKTDTVPVANGSIGASVQEALLANNTTRGAFTFHAELWNGGFCGASFMAVAAALFVAGIAATALVPASSAAMQAGDSNATLFRSESKCVCLSGNGLGSVCSLAVLGSFLMASIDPDAVAVLDSDGAMASDSARAKAVSLDVKAAADSDAVPALNSDRAAMGWW